MIEYVFDCRIVDAVNRFTFFFWCLEIHLIIIRYIIPFIIKLKQKRIFLEPVINLRKVVFICEKNRILHQFRPSIALIFIEGHFPLLNFQLHFT